LDRNRERFAVTAAVLLWAVTTVRVCLLVGSAARRL
jgi:hypothetical protein